MSKLEGKVAFITGAARGQGRSHAVKLASEGAAIIAVDICRQIETVEYPLATPDDLAETVREVEAVGGRIVAREADVRDFEALKAIVAEGEAELGKLDIILANAGVSALGLSGDPVQPFLDMIAVNLSGVYFTVMAGVDSLIEKKSGSIVLTSSSQGLKGTGGSGGPNVAYAASKHGLVGLMRSWAKWLSPMGIRVNTVHPTGVATPMIQNEVLEKLFADAPPETLDSVKNLIPVPWVESSDVSNAIAFLVSEEGRYITGVTLPVDAGFAAR